MPTIRRPCLGASPCDTFQTRPSSNPHGTILLQVRADYRGRHTFLPALLGPANTSSNCRGRHASFGFRCCHNNPRLSGSSRIADRAGPRPPDAVVTGPETVRAGSSGRVVIDVNGTESFRGHVQRGILGRHFLSPAAPRSCHQSHGWDWAWRIRRIALVRDVVRS